MRSKLRYPTILGYLPLIALLLLTVGVVPSLEAQQFGGNPPSLKWRQLKTDSVNILFPKGADSTAFRVAGIIQRLQKAQKYLLGNQLENVPIVLQNQTANSNGYVGLGPYRSEFYLAAPMDVLDLGSLDWASTLALHEYRHVLQYNNINRGLTRAVDFVLGDNARSLFSDMAVPNWFFEGDAVYNETLHSTQGRGRLPRLMNVYATIDKDGKQYNYQKLRNGSYKDYIPGHYELGYLLVAYGYKQYGPAFWGKVISDAARYKGLFYPFQKAITRQTGVSFKQFRTAAFKSYQNEFLDLAWKEVPTKEHPNGALHRLSGTSNKEVVDYLYPYPSQYTPSAQPGQGMQQRAIIDTGGAVIALKRPAKSVSRFVYLHDGLEKDLGQAPISRDPYFGYNGHFIIYTRYQTDPRWTYREYSDLELLDIATGARKRLTHKARYFTPDIQKNGQLIAASDLKTDGRSAIVLLNQNGQVLQRLEAPRALIYNYPKFYKSALVFLMRKADGQMGIGYISLTKGEVVPNTYEGQLHTLLPFEKQLLAYPVVVADKLFFSRVRPGLTDPYTELMELDLTGLKEEDKNAGSLETDGLTEKADSATPLEVGRFVRDMFQGYGTDTNTGNRSGRLVASLQTAEGYGIFACPGLVGEAQHLTQNSFKGYMPIRSKKEDNDNDNDNDNGVEILAGAAVADTGVSGKVAEDASLAMDSGRRDYANSVKKYPLLSHPFHFHSLQPMVEDPVYSLDLMGQNILNTVQTQLSYSYNRVSEISSVGGDLTLGLWYIEPFAHVDYSWDHLAADNKGHQYSYQELTSQLGLQLPLSFTGGRWSRSLYLSTALSQSNLYWREPKPQAGSALQEIRYLFSRLQLSMYARQAARQLYPRFGLNNYTEINTPLDGKGARQWMNSTTIYLPGVLTTHSLRWNLAYQNRDTAGAYGYSSRFPFSRGYVRPSFSSMWKFGADYDLPLWYPDFGFGGLVYCSRIRGNIYYDQSYGYESTKKRSSYGSLGGAVFADMNIGNQYPITIGLRYNHLLNKNFPQKNNWELILPIRLF